MRVRDSVSLLLVFVLMTTLSARSADYDVQATARWRAQIETDLKSSTGWLTVAGLFFLAPGTNTVGTAATSAVHLPDGSGPAVAAVLEYEAPQVSLVPRPGSAISVNGAVVSSRVVLRASDRVTVGRVTLQQHRSGSRVGIRLRDPESALLKAFTTRQWFAIDPRWEITGRFLPFETPRRVPGENILGDETSSVSPGEVEVTIDGHTIRLLAYGSERGLSFVLRDATADRETYAIRFLSAAAPTATGVVVLDFNRAYNPPCAFNPHTTCPVPPSQNRLSIPISAGEKLYAKH